MSRMLGRNPWKLPFLTLSMLACLLGLLILCTAKYRQIQLVMETLFLLVGAAMAIVVFPFRRHWDKEARSLAGRCVNCGYDLRASPDRCPECGLATEETR